MKFLLLIFILILASCSHEQSRQTVTISSSVKGIVKNQFLENPLFITSNLTDKDVPEKAVKIHQGHFLILKNSKEANEKILTTMEATFHLVNLTLEDIAIAEAQNINFENYKKLIFLNSTISDVTRDDLYGKTNVLPYYTLGEVVFIGLSDNKIDKSLNANRFLINDYVFSVLKIKKLTREKNYKSYILIHNLGSDINEIMGRLPPTFINSLAN